MKALKHILSVAIVLSALAVAGVSAQGYVSSGSNQTIERQVSKKLLGLPNYNVFDSINFQVSGSTVTLGGKVNSLGTRDDAARAVKRIAGVTNVVNNIEQLSPSGFDQSIRLNALRTFSQTGLGRYLYFHDPDVRIIVENGRITLEGYVANRGDYNYFNVLANGIPNTFQVTNNLIVGKEPSM